MGEKRDFWECTLWKFGGSFEIFLLKIWNFKKFWTTRDSVRFDERRFYYRKEEQFPRRKSSGFESRLYLFLLAHGASWDFFWSHFGKKVEKIVLEKYYGFKSCKLSVRSWRWKVLVTFLKIYPLLGTFIHDVLFFFQDLRNRSNLIEMFAV